MSTLWKHSLQQPSKNPLLVTPVQCLWAVWKSGRWLSTDSGLNELQHNVVTVAYVGFALITKSVLVSGLEWVDTFCFISVYVQSSCCVVGVWKVSCQPDFPHTKRFSKHLSTISLAHGQKCISIRMNAQSSCNQTLLFHWVTFCVQWDSWLILLLQFVSISHSYIVKSLTIYELQYGSVTKLIPISFHFISIIESTV